MKKKILIFIYISSFIPLSLGLDKLNDYIKEQELLKKEMAIKQLEIDKKNQEYYKQKEKEKEMTKTHPKPWENPNQDPNYIGKNGKRFSPDDVNKLLRTNFFYTKDDFEEDGYFVSKLLTKSTIKVLIKEKTGKTKIIVKNSNLFYENIVLRVGKKVENFQMYKIANMSNSLNNFEFDITKSDNITDFICYNINNSDFKIKFQKGHKESVISLNQQEILGWKHSCELWLHY